MIPRPLFDQIVVTPIVERESPGGIWLPEGLDRKDGAGLRGTVVAIGPGRTLECGLLVPIPLDVGEEIVYSKYAGTIVNVGVTEYTVIRIDDVRVVLMRELVS